MLFAFGSCYLAVACLTVRESNLILNEVNQKAIFNYMKARFYMQNRELVTKNFLHQISFSSCKCPIAIKVDFPLFIVLRGNIIPSATSLLSTKRHGRVTKLCAQKEKFHSKTSKSSRVFMKVYNWCGLYLKKLRLTD